MVLLKTPQNQLRICITGVGGFIASHLAKRLKNEGHYIVGCDWKRNQHMQENEMCDEFHLCDLRVFDNCMKVVKDCDHVYNLAADMGGMGFIQSNNAAIIFNNTMISFNMLEASRLNNVKQYFYASSACVYPEFKQTDTQNQGLQESDAWPAQPQDAYGLEKLYAEEMCMHYAKDYGMHVRIGRYHNVYGPFGTWKGGREKSPAALCRKVLVSTDSIEVWGDGQQTRSFIYIDDCVEGTLRLMNSDVITPINIGSTEMVTINDMIDIICSFEGKSIQKNHIVGPLGVRGRNSDNTKILEHLDWEPPTRLSVGLKILYEWIKAQIAKDTRNGVDVVAYMQSTVVPTQQPIALGETMVSVM